MDVTYAVVIKKEYQDLSMGVKYDTYTVTDVFDSYELADNASKNVEGMALANLNRIETNGMLLNYQIKILPLEGRYKKNDVQRIVDILKEKIFTNKNKQL